MAPRTPTSPSSPTSSSTSPRASITRQRTSLTRQRTSRTEVTFTLGDRVRINHTEELATLRFQGPTEFAEGEWYGLELDEPTGKNNGSVQGVRYFECAQKCGLFLKMAPGMLVPLASEATGTKESRNGGPDQEEQPISREPRNALENEVDKVIQDKVQALYEQIWSKVEQALEDTVTRIVSRTLQSSSCSRPFQDSSSKSSIFRPKKRDLSGKTFYDPDSFREEMLGALMAAHEGGTLSSAVDAAFTSRRQQAFDTLVRAQAEGTLLKTVDGVFQRRKSNTAASGAQKDEEVARRNDEEEAEEERLAKIREEEEARLAKLQAAEEAHLIKIHSALRSGKAVDEIREILQGNPCERDACTLLSKPDPKTGNQGIHIAAQNSNLELVQFVLAEGVDASAQNNTGNTALHMSVQYEAYYVTRVLLEKGADKNRKNKDGHKAIHGIEGTKKGNDAWNTPLKLLKAARNKEALDQAMSELEKADPDTIDKSDLAKAGMLKAKELNSDWDKERFKALMKTL